MDEDKASRAGVTGGGREANPPLEKACCMPGNLHGLRFQLYKLPGGEYCYLGLKDETTGESEKFGDLFGSRSTKKELEEGSDTGSLPPPLSYREGPKSTAKTEVITHVTAQTGPHNTQAAHDHV